MMRRLRIPTDNTSGSVVKKRMISCAKSRNTTVTTAINIMFHIPVNHTARSARSGFRAPKFCPTSVAAALLKPHDGRMTKMTTRMEIT